MPSLLIVSRRPLPTSRLSISTRMSRMRESTVLIIPFATVEKDDERLSTALASLSPLLSTAPCNAGNEVPRISFVAPSKSVWISRCH